RACQLLFGQSAIGNLGLEGQRDTAIVALGSARHGQPAARLFGGERQIGKRKIEAEIRLPGGELAVGRQGKLLVLNLELVGGQAGLVSGDAAGDRGDAAEQAVGGGIVDGEVGRLAVDN